MTVKLVILSPQAVSSYLKRFMASGWLSAQMRAL